MAEQDIPPPTAMKIPIIRKGESEKEPPPTGETSLLLLLRLPTTGLLERNHEREAIKSRFGGNVESKKMQKNVLKHQFEKFSTTSNENLGKAYDRFQKLISQLEVHGAPISKEDINQKFLRSSSSFMETNCTNPIRNKPDIEEIKYLMKLVLPVEDFGVSTAGGINQVPSTHINGLEKCLEELDLRWQVAMLTVRVKKFIQRTGRNLDFKEKRLVSLDKTKIECYNCHRKGHFARECRSGRNQGRRSYGDNGREQCTQRINSTSQALMAQDGLGGYGLGAL
ncbi:ribonuclease H-like domain-containing protein [Tanacetum coccineum]|uniref:Ribonuclease H-like domain-containing protein n=2 Tax=Tanacetum coccineum TaxID=301880 RepID=A0ABQ5AAS7_9ASTR